MKKSYEWRRTENSYWKLTCVWEDDVYLDIKVFKRGVNVWSRHDVWLRRTIRQKLIRERWERSKLRMIVASLLQKDEDDVNHDRRTSRRRDRHDDSGVTEKSEDDKIYLKSKRAQITREDLRNFGFTTRCPTRIPLVKVNDEISARRKLTKTNWRGVERQRWDDSSLKTIRGFKEYQDKVVEREKVKWIRKNLQ